jgi:hypothetical protein
MTTNQGRVFRVECVVVVFDTEKAAHSSCSLIFSRGKLIVSVVVWRCLLMLLSACGIIFLLFKHAILFASIHPRIGRVRLTEFRTVHLLISALPGNPQVGAPLFSCDRRAYHNYWISATASS